MASGHDMLRAAVAGLPTDFSYAPVRVVAEDGLVMIHGRLAGWGPKPQVAIDIFRVEGGQLAEHWDVIQEEVPASETASGSRS